MLIIPRALRSRRKLKENWFKRNSSLIQAFSTGALVFVTMIYVFITWELNESSQEQLKLITDPQILVYSEFRPILLLMKDSTLTFSVKNYSNSNLLDFELRMKFYIHHIDSLCREKFIEYSNRDYFNIDLYHFKLKKKSVDTISINFKSYIDELSKVSGYFYLTDTLNGDGHWEKLNLKRNWKQMFSVFDFTYYREEDGKQFSSVQYFRVHGFPLSVGNILFARVINLNDLIRSHRRDIRSLIERDDSPYNDPDFFKGLQEEFSKKTGK